MTLNNPGAPLELEVWFSYTKKQKKVVLWSSHCAVFQTYHSTGKNRLFLLPPPTDTQTLYWVRPPNDRSLLIIFFLSTDSDTPIAWFHIVLLDLRDKGKAFLNSLVKYLVKSKALRVVLELDTIQTQTKLFLYLLA